VKGKVLFRRAVPRHRVFVREKRSSGLEMGKGKRHDVLTFQAAR